jgi:hypothetical protein
MISVLLDEHAVPSRDTLASEPRGTAGFGYCTPR